jgi:MYXO-CTERM domain-containing protein
VPALVAYHDAAAQRRASYKPETTGSPGIAWGYPGAVVTLIAGAAVLMRRRRSKRP